jgi:hypothetical protein
MQAGMHAWCCMIVKTFYSVYFLTLNMERKALQAESYRHLVRITALHCQIARDHLIDLPPFVPMQRQNWTRAGCRVPVQ